MKDIHKELAKRSIKDAAYLQTDVAEEYGVQIPPEFVGQFALAMYQHRVEQHRMNIAEAKQEAMYPDSDPNAGRF